MTRSRWTPGSRATAWRPRRESRAAIRLAFLNSPQYGDVVSHYDAIVIGAGQGGGPLAGAFARAGRRTTLVERVHVGGTCVNEGCSPTKTMVASARVAHLVRRAGDYGVGGGSVNVDMRRV